MRMAEPPEQGPQDGVAAASSGTLPAHISGGWLAALESVRGEEPSGAWSGMLDVPESIFGDGSDLMDMEEDAESDAHGLVGPIVPVGGGQPEWLAEVDYGDKSLASFAGVVSAMVSDGPRPGDMSDGDVRDIAKQALDSQMILSDHAVAEVVGVDPKAYRTLAAELAELWVVADRWCRFHLERGIVQAVPAVDLLLYLDVSSFDETTLPMTVRDAGVSVSADGSMLPISDVAFAGDSLDSVGAELRPAVPAKGGDTHKTKVLQTQSAVHILVRIGSRLLAIESGTIHWLQVVERTTGEVISKALELSDGRSPAAEEFRTNLRITTVDKASNIARAECGLLSPRPANFPRSPDGLPCAHGGDLPFEVLRFGRRCGLRRCELLLGPFDRLGDECLPVCPPLCYRHEVGNLEGLAAR